MKTVCDGTQQITAIYVSGESSISGTLPDVFAELVALRQFTLSGTQVGGRVPPSLLSHPRLSVLDLRDNDFEGAIPDVSLSRRRLAQAPPGGGEGEGPLTVIDLSFNRRMSGAVPESFCALNRRLAKVIMTDMQLEGELPADCGRLPELKELILDNNRISGDISNWLNDASDLGSLEILEMRRNRLDGALPADVHVILPRLRELALTQNSLAGPLPSLPRGIEVVDLQANALSGALDLDRMLPGWSTGTPFASLRRLYLTRNFLEGEIPAAVAAAAPNLEILLLADNQLRGELPEEVCRLGEIFGGGGAPAAAGFVSFFSVADNVRLCGRLPSCFGGTPFAGASSNIDTASPFYKTAVGMTCDQTPPECEQGERRFNCIITPPTKSEINAYNIGILPFADPESQDELVYHVGVGSYLFEYSPSRAEARAIKDVGLVPASVRTTALGLIANRLSRRESGRRRALSGLPAAALPFESPAPPGPEGRELERFRPAEDEAFRQAHRRRLRQQRQQQQQRAAAAGSGAAPEGDGDGDDYMILQKVPLPPSPRDSEVGRRLAELDEVEWRVDRATGAPVAVPVSGYAFVNPFYRVARWPDGAMASPILQLDARNLTALREAGADVAGMTRAEVRGLLEDREDDFQFVYSGDSWYDCGDPDRTDAAAAACVDIGTPFPRLDDLRPLFALSGNSDPKLLFKSDDGGEGGGEGGGGGSSDSKQCRAVWNVSEGKDGLVVCDIKNGINVYGIVQVYNGGSALPRPQRTTSVSPPTLLDGTPPTGGRVFATRDCADSASTFNSQADTESLPLCFYGFEDTESGVVYYEFQVVRVLPNTGMDGESSQRNLTDWVLYEPDPEDPEPAIGASANGFALADGDVVFVRVKAVNLAGLETVVSSNPVVIESHDDSVDIALIVIVVVVVVVAALVFLFVLWRFHRYRKDMKRREAVRERRTILVTTMNVHLNRGTPPFSNIENEKPSVTFVFTDVESSTLLNATDPEAYAKVQAVHDNVMREEIAKHQGYEIATEGDAFQVAWTDPCSALSFATQVQARLLSVPWTRDVLKLPKAAEVHAPDSNGELLVWRGPRVRIGVTLVGPEEYSRSVHPVTKRIGFGGSGFELAKEVGDAGFGGQVVVTDSAWQQIRKNPGAAGFPRVKDIGQYRVLGDRVHLYDAAPTVALSGTGIAHRGFERVEDEYEMLAEGRGLDVVPVPAPDGDGTFTFVMLKIESLGLPPAHRFWREFGDPFESPGAADRGGAREPSTHRGAPRDALDSVHTHAVGAGESLPAHLAELYLRQLQELWTQLNGFAFEIEPACGAVALCFETVTDAVRFVMTAQACLLCMEWGDPALDLAKSSGLGSWDDGTYGADGRLLWRGPRVSMAVHRTADARSCARGPPPAKADGEARQGEERKEARDAEDRGGGGGREPADDALLHQELLATDFLSGDGSTSFAGTGVRQSQALLATCHGGQIILSEAAWKGINDKLSGTPAPAPRPATDPHRGSAAVPRSL